MPNRTIVAVFDSRAAAQNAREKLLGLGIKEDEIGITDQTAQSASGEELRGERGGFWTHVKEMFMPDEDRAAIDESIRRGGFVLSARASDQRADEAIACMERAGAIDLDQRTSEWRASGWNGTSTSASSASSSHSGNARTTEQPSESATLPVVEEQLRVGKREINRGSVRARSYIVEEPVEEQVHLRDEHVEVERRPVNEPTRPVAQGSPEDLLKERAVEMTETAEQAVVGKEATVTEEVRLKKTAGERVENVRESLRHTEVDVQDGRTESPDSVTDREPTSAKPRGSRAPQPRR